MIIVRIIGGLGNQMFQYAAGRSLAASRGTALELDTRDFAFYPLQPFGLSKLRIDTSVSIGQHSHEFPRWKRRVLARLPQGLSRAYYKERSLAYDPAWERLGSHVYLDGYFQSERFFDKVAPILRREFIPAMQSVHPRNMCSERLAQEESVALHVRRGDYVSDRKTLATHGVCSIEYYRRALDLVRNSLKAPRFYLFSNDLEWSRENLTLPSDVVCVDWNGGAPEWDLYLMSKCRHHVIANSSFSWWGAWLATHPEQLVVWPKPWFDDQRLDASDLVPARWTALAKS